MTTTMSTPVPDVFAGWHEWLQDEYTCELSFTEYRRGVEALSSNYIGKRHRIGEASQTFSGKAKRAAFAAFYSPLHFLTIWNIVHELELHTLGPKRILDLGSGLGVASGAWALAQKQLPRVSALDKSDWAAKQAKKSLYRLGVPARTQRVEIEKAPMPIRGEIAVLAFAVNELTAASRAKLLERCLACNANTSSGILIVEPIARRGFDWWHDWEASFEKRGGRADEWRFDLDLPESMLKVDRAVGFDHRVQKARSLWIGNKHYRGGA